MDWVQELRDKLEAEYHSAVAEDIDGDVFASLAGLAALDLAQRFVITQEEIAICERYRAGLMSEAEVQRALNRGVAQT